MTKRLSRPTWVLALVVAVVSSAVVVGAGTGASAAAFTGPAPGLGRATVPTSTAGDSPIGPVTALHYAPNGNFSTTGTYLPGSDGFNIADASSIAQVDSLPVGVKALVYLGLCDGADTNFIDLVQQFIGNPDVYGFYLVDEPDPTGEYSPQCPATDLKAESDWIHANDPGTVTFIVLMNLGTPSQPDFMDAYNSANTDIDLFGLDPYPCMKELHGCDNDVIGLSVSAALASGLTTDQIVPVYQAFGGGGYRQWTVPTPAEELEILSTWRSLTPDPAFDFAYSWGQQSSDRSLENEPKLQAVFDQQNGVPAAAPLQITTTSLPAASRGVPYRVQLQAVGGVGPYHWKAVAGLPKGLRLSGGGVISGTAKPNDTPAAYNLSLSVHDSTRGARQTAGATLSLAVA